MSDGFRIAASSVDAVRAEAAALRGLLEANVARFRRDRRQIHLEADESPLVLAFWNEVGWSDIFKGWHLEAPEMKVGRDRVQQLLEEYRAEGGFSLTLADLPPRFRLVDEDSQGVGFAITDESRGPDPEVLAVIQERNALIKEHTSYLNWCANQCVRRALNPWYRTSFKLKPSTAVADGEKPFGILSPATRRLTPDLWVVPNQAPSMKVGQPGGICRFAHARFESLITWLLDSPSLGQIERVGPASGDTLVLTVGSEALPGTGDPLRRLEGFRPDRGYWVGYLDSIAVLLEEQSGSLRAIVGPRERDALQQLLRRRGWLR